jgi:hypothetical protein
MRSPKARQKLEPFEKAVQANGCDDEPTDDETDTLETSPEADENDLDESDLGDDDRWDVFILDDEGDPLPEYGDFWFPD